MNTKNKKDKFNFVTMDEINQDAKSLEKEEVIEPIKIEDFSNPPDNNSISSKKYSIDETIQKELGNKVEKDSIDINPLENKEEPLVSSQDVLLAEQSINVGDIQPKEITNEKFEEVEEKKERIFDHSKEIKRRIHFSFEARVVTMLIFIFLLLLSSCYFVLEAIHYGKNEIISYDENGTAHYQVCLKPNEYYTNPCLSEDMQYVSSLIDKISATFQYKALFSESIPYDFSYHIQAITKVYDHDNLQKILYKNEETLVDRTPISNQEDSILIDEKLSIDYNKYNQLVMDYKNRYALNSTASVELVLYLDEKSESRNVSSISIPLGTQTFSITKNNVSEKNHKIDVPHDSWNRYNTICAIIASVLILICLILVYKTTRLVLKVTNSRSKYQQKLSQLLREYDRIIVIARDGYESNREKDVIKLDSFNELLDARDALEKPIIYSRVNDVKSEFIVEDEEKLFKYVLKESDL